MNRLLESFFDWNRDESAAPLAAWMPQIDLKETDASVVVRAEIPGVEAKDIEVEVVGDSLVIKGEKRSESEEKGATWRRRESHFGRFYRAIPLPAEVDGSKIEAVEQKGVLTITCPKTAPAKAKKIAVKSK
jgi:HSP20 family protein